MVTYIKPHFCSAVSSKFRKKKLHYSDDNSMRKNKANVDRLIAYIVKIT